MGGSASLAGGERNDFIHADLRENAFFPSATDRLSFFTNIDSDTLHGGTGNDQLSASQGDRLSGGAGTDSFTLYLNEGVASPAATITDFDQATEQVTVLFGAIDANSNTDDMDLTDNITFATTTEGNTRILGGGAVLVTVQVAENLRVGVAVAGGEGPVTTMDGAERPASNSDVIVARYANTSS